MQHIETKNSLDSKLQIDSKCSLESYLEIEISQVQFTYCTIEIEHGISQILRRILMEYIESICTSESKQFLIYICSIEILSRY